MAIGARFLDFAEARDQARRFLPKALFDYIDRGTEAETAIADIHQGFASRRIVPRVLRPVSAPDLSVEYLGGIQNCPFVIAPTALAGMVRHNGEIKMARAARQAGLPFVVATQSSTSVEQILANAHGSELWFQLYVWKDRNETWKLLERARACGVETLVLTVDTPASPKKVHNRRNGFGVPLEPSATLAIDLMLHPRWTLSVMGRYLMRNGFPSYAHYPGDVAAAITSSIRDPRFALDTILDRDFLRELRKRWRYKLIIKGILSASDAVGVFKLGCDGVVVSAHGGRNLDSAARPLNVLPKIREAVGPGKTLFADSGVRRGSDAAKLLAAGADGVFLGRAPLYGLAAGGTTGVVRMIEQFNEELSLFLAFAGAENIAALRQAEWIG
ncbi:alpha-hydroxy acid oxidase [Brucella intermedia]|uniref:alpha-hydroxy acid oxidase n=1 Tax=Brucella intermedia TaxID=94625 RepID=UPI001591630D|nr:alpha-hydroxy acid oxidase [Brucella intermedia]